jgi:RIO-like serine/threonine protein kinase
MALHAIQSAIVRRGGLACVQGYVSKTLLDVATGMQYLHGLGIVHGDLKAANVLLKSTNTDNRGFICKYVQCCWCSEP